VFDQRPDATLRQNRISRSSSVPGAHGRPEDPQLEEEDPVQLRVSSAHPGGGARDHQRAARPERPQRSGFQVAAPTVSITASTRAGSRVPDSNTAAAPSSSARARLAASRPVAQDPQPRGRTQPDHRSGHAAAAALDEHRAAGCRARPG